MAEQDSGGLFWRQIHSAELESELTPQEKALRDRFVKEYLVDYRPKAAAIRCGFKEAYAEQYANRFMNESYVQSQIKQAEASVVYDEEDEKQKIKQEIMAELRYLMKVGTFASRVSAAAKLTSIMGMDAPTKSEQTINHRGGVMAVPGIAKLDEWEKAAEESQTKLVAETRA